MNRRSLLKMLTGGAAALAFDPERLLWVPGAKTIFIPSTEVKIYDEMDMLLAQINSSIFMQFAIDRPRHRVYWEGRAFEARQLS